MKKRGMTERGERYEKGMENGLEVGRAGTMEVKATKGCGKHKSTQEADRRRPEK